MKITEKELVVVYMKCMEQFPEENEYFSGLLNEFVDEKESEFTEEYCKELMEEVNDCSELRKKFIMEIIVASESKNGITLYCDNFSALRKIDRINNVVSLKGMIKCPYCDETHKV